MHTGVTMVSLPDKSHVSGIWLVYQCRCQSSAYLSSVRALTQGDAPFLFWGVGWWGGVMDAGCKSAGSVPARRGPRSSPWRRQRRRNWALREELINGHCRHCWARPRCSSVVLSTVPPTLAPSLQFWKQQEEECTLPCRQLSSDPLMVEEDGNLVEEDGNLKRSVSQYSVCICPNLSRSNVFCVSHASKFSQRCGCIWFPMLSKGRLESS